MWNFWILASLPNSNNRSLRVTQLVTQLIIIKSILGFHLSGLWDWTWYFGKVHFVNFSCRLLTGTRQSLGGWHKIEQVSDKMKYVWPTQRQLVALTFPKHSLNECLHSVKRRKKKINQLLWFEEKSKRKKMFLFLTIDKNQSVSSRRDQAARAHLRHWCNPENKWKCTLMISSCVLAEPACILCRVRATHVQVKRTKTNNNNPVFQLSCLQEDASKSNRTEQWRLYIHGA